MKMRGRMHSRGIACVLGLLALGATAHAAESEAADGLKAALNQATAKAVAALGRPDGFLKNEEVRIPLPGKLQDARKTLRKLGLKKEVDQLELAMNRAAEAAVPEAKALLLDAVRQISVTDAVGILKGPEDAATQYFREATSAQLAERFKPIVAKATANVELTKRYDKVAGKASSLGLIDRQDATMDDYVTRKALDGLFLVMAKEEAAIRRNPAKQADALLRRVFGGLK